MNTRMKDGPLTREELEAVRVRLRKMSDAQLVRQYNAGLQMCQLNQGRPPSASYVQQLVQAWRELVRRRRVPS